MNTRAFITIIGISWAVCFPTMLGAERLLVDTGRVTIPGAYTRPHAPGVELGHITIDLPDIRWESEHYDRGTIHEYIEVISRPTDNPVHAIFVLEEGRINETVVPFGHHWCRVDE